MPFPTSGSWPGSRTATGCRSVLCGCWRASTRTMFRPNLVSSITAGASAAGPGDATDLYRRSNRQAQVPGQTPGGEEVIIPKRILYIDSEGWFIAASHQYDRERKLWKAIATFKSYHDRPVPDARVAISVQAESFRPRWSIRTCKTASPRWCTCRSRNGRTRAHQHEVTRSFLDPLPAGGPLWLASVP